MESVAIRVTRLPGMNIEELQNLWRQIFREEPAFAHNRSYMIQRLAHQMQVAAHGDLSQHDRQRLDRYLTGLDDNPHGRIVKPVTGTIITREWQGVEHRVTVLEDGFEYQNIKYRSLSQVARKITGTAWSGPVFFGLKRKRGDK